MTTALRHPPRRCAPRCALATCGVALALLACSTTGEREPPRGLARLWHEYLALADEKALAIAGDPENQWVAGLSSGHSFSEEAVESALSACQARRGQRRLQTPCRLYAIGEKIVWESP